MYHYPRERTALAICFDFQNGLSCDDRDDVCSFMSDDRLGSNQTTFSSTVPPNLRSL